MNAKLWKRVQASWLVSALGLATFVLVAETGRAALPEGRSVDIEAQGTSVSLSWLSITNAPYVVEARTNLVQGGWGVLDTIVNAGGVTVYPVTPDDSPSRFFRVLFPQPTVTAGEPARYAHGTGGSYLYITGEFFYAGDQVSVGGLPAASAVFVTPSLLRVELPPGLPPGRHDVAILSAHTGAVLALLHEAVTVVDPLVEPDRLLVGPPDVPPASPMALWMSKRGYDYYKAASDNAAAGLQTNPYYVDSNLQGEMPAVGGWLSRKGYQYYMAMSDNAASASSRTDALSDSYIKRKLNKVAYVGPPDNGKGISERGIKLFDDSSASITVPDNGKGISQPGIKLFDDSSAMSAGFEIVDGKKGLNAVNVKLARMAGAGNLGSSGQDGVEVRKTRKLVATNIGSSGQDGVSLFSGDVQECVVDMAVPGRGLDFVWARTYHSRLGRTGSSTNGWTFSYDLHLQPLGGDLLVHGGTGRADRFVLQPNGVYTCPEFFCEGTLSADVFRLTFADTGYWEFRPLNAATAPGKLDRIVDRNGNTVSLSYDPAGRLSAVVDDLGRSYTVAYDTAGRLASVRDFSERTVRYLYDGNGDLTACVSPPVTQTPTGNDFPNGKTNSYTYTSGSTVEAENHLLLSCVDGLGQTTTQVGYDLSPASPSYLRCVSLRRGNHPPIICTYQPQTPTPDNRFAALRCIVNDPVGNVNELLYDCRGRGIEKAQIKRRAEPGQPVTDTAALPYDKLRPDDPDSTVTRWSWNNDSLCTSATAPGGQVVSYTYQGDLEPSTPARKRADCRLVSERATEAVDLDGDGVADATERAWHFHYDPRFGSDPTGQRLYGPGKAHWGNARLRSGVLAEVGTGSGIASKAAALSAIGSIPVVGGHLAAAYVTSATDPRGNVTEANYDEQGNCRALIVPATRSSTGAITFSLVHDAHGQLTAITNAPDANGRSRVDTFAYSQGQLTACVVDAGADGLALTTALEYDARGNLTRCVDPRTNDWLFTYNSLDQCVRVQSPVNVSARCSTGFLYDANDNLVQSVKQIRNETDQTIGTCTNRASYDELHRLTEVALAVDDAHALTNRFVYDGNDQCIQVLGGEALSGVDPHHTVMFEYDTCGLLYRTVAAPGSADVCTTQYDYDPNGLLTRVSEGLEEAPSITTLAYDGFAGCPSRHNWIGSMARLAQITDPMGNVSTFHHDANDNLTVARQFGQTVDAPGSDGNIRLAESRYAYDGLDRCVAHRDLHFGPATQLAVGDGECTTTFAYAPNGACIAITNDLGGVTTASYDTAGRVYSVRVPGDKSLRVCFRDAAGNVTSITQTDTPSLGGPQQSFTRTFAYDSQNRCVSTIDGVSKTNSCAYDSLGRVVRATDAAGTQTFHSYDLLGRCTLTVHDLDGDGFPDLVNDINEQASWSSSSERLLSTTDSHGNTTSYAYDSRDRCVAVTCADGTQQQLVWSPRSNLVQTTDPNGTVSVCTYDSNNRLTRRDITTQAAGGGGALYLETFAFDGCDRLSGHRDDDCDGDFAYDSLGSCVSETLNGLATASTYDALGNRLSLAYPGGRVLTYAYDASGGCTNIFESGASLASFAYDGVDRLARVTYGNGLRSTFAYDGLDGVQNEPGDHGFGQVSHVVHASTNGATVKISHLSWDLKENKKGRTMPPSGTGGSDNVLTIEYDRADRLVRSTVTEGTATLRDTTYSLDRMGNRTNVTGAACSGPYTMDAFAPGSLDFQMNQYSATPCDTRTYDDNGNLVSRSAGTVSSLSFTYDYADRLVSVSDAGLTVASYTYDALGRRVTKTVSAGAGLPPSTRHYCYDGSCVIEEREDTAVVASYVGACMSGQCVTMRRSGQDYFFLSEDQGNTVALTDASGTVVEGYDYDDYGAVTFLGADGMPLVGSDGMPATSSAVGNPYCWGGLRLDAETGLHNNDGGDYFEPQTGRATRGKIRMVKDQGNGNFSDGDSTSLVASKHYITIPHDRRVPGGSNGNNPWSGGSPLGMQKGTVKFFNETKGFGMANKAIKESKIIGNTRTFIETKGFSNLIR